jgi:predicted transcriptional regulator
MNMTKRWADLKNKKLSPKQLEEIQERVEQEIVAINLKALRQLLGKTQVKAAEVANMSQAELSRMDRRQDHLLSTLQRYVKALGGELEITAVFEDKRVTMKGL